MSGANDEKSDAEELDLIYSQTEIVERIKDYLGGEVPTAHFLARCDGRSPTAIEKFPVSDLHEALSLPTDLARSLGDREHYIIHLDIEYVDLVSPESAIIDPGRAFALQQPTVNAIEECLVRYGIRPLHLITGQGHHFVWQFPKKSELSQLLITEILPPSQKTQEKSHDDSIFQAIGLVMEYLAGEIKRKASRESTVPVEITAVAVGTGRDGRHELVSIDISEYGDPLESRVIRIPFTHYMKPWYSGMVDRIPAQRAIPRLVTLPLHEIDIRQALEIRKSSAEITSLARRTLVTIPLQESGMTRLVEAYRHSNHFEFHQHFYSWDPEKEIPALDVSGLPACVIHVLENPNDLLLKPAQLQLVTRTLLAQRRHPAEIAALIAGIFSDPSYRWMENYWEIYNPKMRSEFYVRLFSALVAVGIDEAIDFNCVSSQEKGLCPCSSCAMNLLDLKNSLLKTKI